MAFGSLTGEQIRAARALARIEQAELAQRGGLSLETIKRLERIRGKVDANSRTLAAIVQAFAELGVTFASDAEGGFAVRLAAGPRLAPAPQAASTLTGEASPMHRLIYFSTATLRPNERIKAVVDGIVEAALRRNAGLGVTGALFACGGRFLQVLEGPKESVRQVFGAISCDTRHKELTVIENRPVPARHFADWQMCCGLFSTDDLVLGGEPALQDGFRPETLSAAAALGLLSIVRDLQVTAPRNGRGPGGDCPLACDCRDIVCASSARCGGDAGSPAFA